jgi:hypothetical protein
VFELIDGELRVKAGTVLDASVKSEYDVTVQVDDATRGSTPDASASYKLVLQRFLGLTVQQGAVGRSYVRFVDLNFETAQGLDAIVASVGTKVPRIQLSSSGMDGTRNISKSLSGRLSVNGNSIRIDFGMEGIGGQRNGRVPDGLYRVSFDLDGDGKREAGASFHRLLGDADGNGVVDAADQSLVNSQLGQSGINLLGDVNGDGVVNLQDRTRVRRLLGRSLNRK